MFWRMLVWYCFTRLGLVPGGMEFRIRSRMGHIAMASLVMGVAELGNWMGSSIQYLPRARIEDFLSYP